MYIRRYLLQVQLSSHCCQACNHTESDRDSQVRMKPAWRLLNWPTATLERIRGRNCVDVQTLELKMFSVVLGPFYSTQSNSLSQCPPGTQVPTTNDHGFPSKESSQGGAPSYVCGFKTPFTNPHLPLYL